MSDRDASDRRVVVGVDGSPESRRALRRAAEEATAHETRLEVVMAWTYLGQPGGHFDPDYDETQARRDLDAIVTEELGSARPPDTTLNVINDLPARAMVEAASGAFMVVVGCRGLGGFKALLVGSVCQQLVHHAPCPVLSVPGQERATTEPTA